MGIFSFVKAGKKIYGTIKSVKPALGKSKLKKAVDDVKLSSLKTKGKMKRSFQKMEEDIDPARKKLRRTTQKLKGEKVTESGVSKGKDLRDRRKVKLAPKGTFPKKKEPKLDADTVKSYKKRIKYMEGRKAKGKNYSKANLSRLKTELAAN